MKVFVTGAETLTPLTGNHDANECRFTSVYTFLAQDLQFSLGDQQLDGLAYDPASDLAMFFNDSIDVSVIPAPRPLEVTPVSTADAITVWGADMIYNFSEGIAQKPAMLTDIEALMTQANEASLGWIDAGSGACVCPQFSFWRSRAHPAGQAFLARCSVIGYDFVPTCEWSEDGGLTWQDLPEGTEQTLEDIMLVHPGAQENFTLMVRDKDSPLVVSEPKAIVIIPGA